MMKNNKKKYVLLIILMLLIAFFSSQCMMNPTNLKSKNTVVVLLSSSYNKKTSRILDALRDYACNNSITLDFWYKEQLSAKDLDSLVKKETDHRVIGILLIYPEEYMTEPNKHYDYSNLLAITETMTSSFIHYATFERTTEKAYCLPITSQIIKKIAESKHSHIYIKNTYKLGYKSIQIIDSYSRSKHMQNIIVSCQKLDKQTIESGKLNSLLAN